MTDQAADAFFRDRGFAQALGFGARPALVVVDFINGFTDPDLPLGSRADEAIERANILIDAARGAALPVFFSTVSYVDPDLRDAGIWVQKIRGLATLRAGTPAVEQDARLHRAPGDGLLVKKYASCFFGTDFASRLQSLRIDTLIIAGCTTSGCVRATAIDACQSGFRPMVAREAVSDRSPAAHAQSLVDIETKYGDVLSVAEILAHLKEQTGVERRST
ncbi:isochorismatase family protein [Mesorhizobium australicum]|uniref:Nicotinamidase-related amidase n=1 Tax=Mesorhizobium australicum TaxID=536018 RepID=A0A1X7MNT7_9HYPH|nr:isochorismatase family protein [Mesorhizobium australicum]SMH26502.1 Nicotinamidase-related amidase [Mesorhizobium australicum]